MMYSIFYACLAVVAISSVVAPVILIRKINGYREIVKVQDIAVIALFMTLENAKIDARSGSGVWFITRDDLGRFEHGWVLEQFLDGRTNWGEFLSQIEDDPSGWTKRHTR